MTALSCRICLTEKDEDEDWSVKMCSSCDHERDFCNVCILRHVREEINVKNAFREVPCLNSDCNSKMEHENIRTFATALDFESYEELLFKKFIESIPEFRWCAKPGCGFGAVYDDGENYPIISCPKCRTKTCYVDRVVWHEGKTCQEYLQSIYASEENANRNYIEQNTKPCPGCGYGIEKNDGCDHMRCFQM
ncbi:hypothetical protein GEMRC1_004960 [Eukaryota sp. GEM-RC1]